MASRRKPVPEETQDVVTSFEERLHNIQKVHPQLNPLTHKPFGITAEQRVVLVEAIRAGNFFDAACRMAGVSSDTFQDWMVKGGDPKSDSLYKPDEPVEPYKSFAYDVRIAEAEAESSLLESIRAAGNRDWKAASYILEKRFSDRWAEKPQGVQVATSGNVQIMLPNNNRSGDTSE